MSFGIFIGENASENEVEFFSFQINNYSACTSDTTKYFDDVWLILELSNISKNVISEIESQFRKSKIFKQLGGDGKPFKNFLGSAPIAP